MTIQTSPQRLQRGGLARSTPTAAGLAATLPRRAALGCGATRAAFTMIELMVVLGIIGILIALLVLVGGRVAGTGKQSATQSMIKALDATLGAVTQDRGRLPQAVVRDPRSDLSDPNPEFWPIADGGIEDSPGAELINSGGWLLQLASEIPGASDLTGVDPELLRVYQPAGNGTPQQPQITTPMDAWGNPIRFVHPDFDGNLRNRDPEDVLGPRNPGSYAVTGVTRIGAVESPGDADRLNADGGFAPGNQPYFYSAGPDGKVGVVMEGDEVVQDFNEDNVYSAKPEFDRESP